MRKALSVGDKVIYAASFLRSVQILSKEMADRQGLVLSIEQIAPKYKVALIKWEDTTEPRRVAVRNLIRASERHLELH